MPSQEFRPVTDARQPPGRQSRGFRAEVKGKNAPTGLSHGGHAAAVAVSLGMADNGPVNPLVAPVQSKRVLVGRDRELEAVRRFVDQTASSGGAQLLVGPAGVGKTRLLDEAKAIAGALGLCVLATEGVEFEATLSYAGLNRLIAPLRDHFDLIQRPHRQALDVALGYAAGPPSTPLLIYDAASTLLERASRQRPILIVVDDLPWLDAASAKVLGFVIQRVAGTRTGFIGTARDTEQLPFDRRVLTELDVRPLNGEESELLLRQRHPHLPTASRRRVLEHAQGNPLAILELGTVFQHRHRDRGESGHHVPLTDRLKESFAFRISDLEDATRRSLLLLALDGREDLSVLARVGIDFRDLAPAERAGLVVVDHSQLSLRFVHPLIRSAVVEDADAEQVRMAHLFLAEALCDQPSRRAWHLADAAVDLDGDTAHLLQEAANEALRRGDVYGCAHGLVRAARLSPDIEARRRWLAQAAYLEAEVIGEPADASRHLNDFRHLPECDAGNLHAVIATAVLYADTGGDCGSAHHMIENVVAAGWHGWHADNDELVELFYAWFIICWQAGVPSYFDSYFQALERLRPLCPQELSLLARAFGDPVRLGSGVRDELKRVIDAKADDADSMTIVRLNTAGTYVDLLAPGRRATWRLIEDGRHGDALRPYFRALMVQFLDDYAAGHWQRAQELADEGVEASKNTGMTSSWYFLYAEALLAAVRGDVTEAARWAAQLDVSALAREAFGIQRLNHHARTLAAQAQGDWESAYRHARALSRPGTFDRYQPHALWVAYDLVEAALRTGRREDAMAHVQAMIDLKIRDLSPRLALLTAGAAGLADESPEGIANFETALHATDPSSWPFDYARVQLAYGSRLRRELRLQDARLLLHEALATFEALGAAPWAERTRGELRAARDKAGAPEGATELTPQELTIAELAAGGLSNKEIGAQLFLSPRTVGGHLYRIYPKLGISSRAALRDAISALRSGIDNE